MIIKYGINIILKPDIVEPFLEIVLRKALKEQLKKINRKEYYYDISSGITDRFSNIIQRELLIKPNQTGWSAVISITDKYKEDLWLELQQFLLEISYWAGENNIIKNCCVEKVNEYKYYICDFETWYLNRI